MVQSINQQVKVNKPKRANLWRQWQRVALALAIVLSMSIPSLMAQCALCTKTAQQLGEGPASGLNKGILYLMCIPLGILSIIGYKWYKKERINQAEEAGN